MEEVKIVKILPTKIWKDKDFFGTVHINMQHEGMDPFTICKIHYDYAYTSNSHQAWLSDKIIELLGGKDESQS
jgi:hypothetical protein